MNLTSRIKGITCVWIDNYSVVVYDGCTRRPHIIGLSWTYNFSVVEAGWVLLNHAMSDFIPNKHGLNIIGRILFETAEKEVQDTFCQGAEGVTQL